MELTRCVVVVVVDDDGHPYLCQLLAATRPVRVQTK